MLLSFLTRLTFHTRSLPGTDLVAFEPSPSDNTLIEHHQTVGTGLNVWTRLSAFA